MARPSTRQDRLTEANQGESDMDIAVLGIDLGKNNCSVVALDAKGRVVLRRRMHRESVVNLTSVMTPCVMAMEACCGAHHLGRLLREQGHEVRLMSPEYVRPYVKAQKNDDRDAEAIAEAATRPTMRFVDLKTAEQLDTQSLHRVRDRLVGERTALVNQLRAVLLERGIAIPQGRRRLERRLAEMLEGEDLQLSPRMRSLLEDMQAEWRQLDCRIEQFDDEFAALAKTDDAARRLATIPGIGVLNALRWLRQSATPSPSHGDGTLPPGSGWSRDRSQRAAGPDWWVLANAAINTFASCWFTVLGQHFLRSRLATPR